MHFRSCFIQAVKRSFVKMAHSYSAELLFLFFKDLKKIHLLKVIKNFCLKKKTSFSPVTESQAARMELAVLGSVLHGPSAWESICLRPRLRGLARDGGSAERIAELDRHSL